MTPEQAQKRRDEIRDQPYLSHESRENLLLQVDIAELNRRVTRLENHLIKEALSKMSEEEIAEVRDGMIKDISQAIKQVEGDL